MSQYGSTTFCPECGTSVIFRRSGRKHPGREGEGDWRCEDGHTFDEPTERDRRSPFSLPSDSVAGTIADPAFEFEDLEKAD